MVVGRDAVLVRNSQEGSMLSFVLPSLALAGGDKTDPSDRAVSLRRCRLGRRNWRASFRIASRYERTRSVRE
jgi:hypothetical protein